MSRYDEMCEVARDAQGDWIAKKDRCFQGIAAIACGIRDYCGIPNEQIMYLRWDGEQHGVFSPAKDGGKYVLPQAIEYNEQEDEWNLGICIFLSGPGVFPRLHVSFGLFVTEKEGLMLARAGTVKPHAIDLNVQTTREAFFESVFKLIKESFNEPRRESKSHGFDFVREPEPDRTN